MSCLNNHPAEPRLDYTMFLEMPPPPSPLVGARCLRSLYTVLDTNRRDTGDRQPMLELQQVFFSCPRLQSLSLTIIVPWPSCIPQLPAFGANFDPRGMATRFPPLRELELHGYSVSSAEWDMWRRGMDWQRLISLTLGMHSVGNFLTNMQDVTLNLQVLKIHTYAGEGHSWYTNVERALRSFDTLKELVLDGFVVSVEAIAQHSRLASLHMHMAEIPIAREQRATLSVEQLEYLNRKCPHIENLRLDLNRDGEWVGGLILFVYLGDITLTF